jgi:hypothetical protein
VSQSPSILLAAAVLLVLTGSAFAQPMPTNPEARENVVKSERYSQVLRTSPAFRAKRIQEECGPVTDPQLHAQCVASFPPAAPVSHPMRHSVRHHPPHP